MRVIIIRVHRWLSLALASFWLIQAVTGTLIVFHWELDDLGVPGIHKATDLSAIDRSLHLLAPPGSGRSIASVWTSAGAADRYDVTIEDPAGETVARIDGAGGVLRRIAPGGRSLFDTVVTLHQTLLAGDIGSWIVGISGLLLWTNLLLGSIAAWPRNRSWRQVFRPPPTRVARAARFYGWHRLLGAWVAVPALLLVSAGVALVFEDGLSAALGAEQPPVPEATPAIGPPLSFAGIAAAGLARYPGAKLAAVIFPEAGRGNWVVRVRQVGELRRAYGTTTLTIAPDGRIVADADALTARGARGFVDALFPLHTGEAGGLAGRVAVLAIGVWLTTMIVLGVLLWSARRGRERRR